MSSLKIIIQCLNSQKKKKKLKGNNNLGLEKLKVKALINIL